MAMREKKNDLEILCFLIWIIWLSLFFLTSIYSRRTAMALASRLKMMRFFHLLECNEKTHNNNPNRAEKRAKNRRGKKIWIKLLSYYMWNQCALKMRLLLISDYYTVVVVFSFSSSLKNYVCTANTLFPFRKMRFIVGIGGFRCADKNAVSRRLISRG